MMQAQTIAVVIAGFDPAIHLLAKKTDARIKSAHDGGAHRTSA